MRVLLVAASVLVPAALAGCTGDGCWTLTDGCAHYEGAAVTVMMDGTYDTVAIQEAFGDQARTVFFGGADIYAGDVRASLSFVYGPMREDGSVNTSDVSWWLTVIIDRGGWESVEPGSGDERAREEWPVLRPRYDWVVGRLLEAGLWTVGEPSIACYCSEA